MVERIDGINVGIGADAAPLRKELTEASRLGSRFASDLTRAFEDAALKGRSLADVLRSLALSLSSHALEAALAPITSVLGKSVAGLFGSALTVPFASGGVIASPVAFPLGGTGRMGIAGEAGPEAILPLSRGADGRLGVKAGGHGGSVHITFNVTSPDADSFRRSEGQIAAMLNRAVTRGQRNL
ncbi:phage tail tape measure protein [Methyloceanibacter sp.]|uniref:phage tail tape measure protein n=1 Tax=Methyloceanibacter sp. TaxID=1965321 RepID=UPI003D6CE9C8